MLRGVNKHIIEITETNNKYFEKAIIYVKPEYSHMNHNKLTKNANTFLENLTSQDNKEIKTAKIKRNNLIKIGIPLLILAVAITLYIIF